MKTIVFLLVLLSFGLTLPAAQPAKPQDSFWKTLLRVTGVSATPSQMKSGEDDWPEGGQVWIAEMDGSRSSKLTEESGFRSPVFAPDGKSILALKSNVLWRLPLDDGSMVEVRALPDVTKLVGFDSDDSDKLCVLAEKGGITSVQFVSVRTNEIIRSAHDPGSRKDRSLITHLKDWRRDYGGIHVYPEKQSKAGLSGELKEWTDVFVQRGSEKPVNVSNGSGVSCAHPSLSPNAKRVAFIKVDSGFVTR